MMQYLANKKGQSGSDLNMSMSPKRVLSAGFIRAPFMSEKRNQMIAQSQ
jgi:hypothetical protein